MILGVDVFSGYGVIDWAQAFAAGVRFAFIKCSEGNEPRRNDVRYAVNVAEAKAAGVCVGAYHFAYPLPHGPGKPAGRSPVEQAQRAYEASGRLGCLPGELPPCLDCEWPPHFEQKDGAVVDRWKEWGCTADQIVAWTLEYLAEAEALWGRTPILYTYPHFWKDLGAYGRVPAFARYPLWIANYTHSKSWTPPGGARPLVPAPWSSWTFWQFSADGSDARIPGIPACPVDRDVFNGDEAALRALALVTPEADTVPAVADTSDIIHPDVPMRGREWE